MSFLFSYVFFFKQKTAYEMRISDWSSDVCSSDLMRQPPSPLPRLVLCTAMIARRPVSASWQKLTVSWRSNSGCVNSVMSGPCALEESAAIVASAGATTSRSEEHTSELQSLMRNSYAVFCLKKNKYNKKTFLRTCGVKAKKRSNHYHK